MQSNLAGVLFDAFQFYGRKADGVRSKGGAGGEDTEAGIAAKPRWTDGRFPAFVVIAVEQEQQPEVRKSL